MNTARGYKRFLAVGCSHGSLVNWKAVEKVLQFKARFKPHRTIHLGDVMDYAAFRNGAHGTRDEAVAIGPDIDSGVRMIEELRPTDVLIGNHDDRVWRLSGHYNAVIAHAAGCAREDFLLACKHVKVERLVDHYDINRSWLMLGDAKLLHGWMYSENALRDHAEHFGKCIMAHLHTAGMASGRRSDHPIAYCTGTLADIPAMEYAKARRATARWSYGFVWGYYNDTSCIAHVSQCAQTELNNWILP